MNTPCKLNKAIDIQNKAAEYDFDWKTIAPVFAKLDEEISELKDAIDEGKTEHIQAELGDVLFVIANISRHLNLDPEQALEKTNTKFLKRFNFVLKELNINSTEHKHDLNAMEAEWQKSKKFFP